MSDRSESRRALVVRGGWEGHVPVESTDRFVPFLENEGFTVRIEDDLDVYLEAEELSRTDLVLQIWTMGEITAAQREGLDAAVRAGTGFAGWHGGIADAFRADLEYNFMVGGQFISHPHGFTDYEVTVVPEKASHPIVAGIDRFEVHTEQYYVHADPSNDVLATTTFAHHEKYPWIEGVQMPVVWTRPWGAGRVFVCTVGHKLDDLDTPEVRTIIEKGLLWASR
ncbi:MAG TPA: ThuA domain-containing protein [Actinopolymorphaceae bacterium]